MNEMKFFEFYNDNDEVVFKIYKRTKAEAIAYFKDFYPHTKVAYICER